MVTMNEPPNESSEASVDRQQAEAELPDGNNSNQSVNSRVTADVSGDSAVVETLLDSQKQVPSCIETVEIIHSSLEQHQLPDHQDAALQIPRTVDYEHQLVDLGEPEKVDINHQPSQLDQLIPEQVRPIYESQSEQTTQKTTASDVPAQPSVELLPIQLIALPVDMTEPSDCHADQSKLTQGPEDPIPQSTEQSVNQTQPPVECTEKPIDQTQACLRAAMEDQPTEKNIRLSSEPESVDTMQRAQVQQEPVKQIQRLDLKAQHKLITTERSSSQIDDGCNKQTDQPTLNSDLSSKKVPTPAETKKKASDEKLNMYKALAIKLKKDLVKCREDLAAVREEYSKDKKDLSDRVSNLEETLTSERLATSTTIATLEARVKVLNHNLEISERDLETMQNEFDSYKTRAAQVMQQNSSTQRPPVIESGITVEADRYRQIKALTDDQQRRLKAFEAQLTNEVIKYGEQEVELKAVRDRLERANSQLAETATLSDRCDALVRENDNLKSALRQYISRVREPGSSGLALENYSNAKVDVCDVELITSRPAGELATNRLSPSQTSIRDESHTNSSSSCDGSTSGGYVHIRPAPFEIISKSSVLDEAQNQIDNLTKAYLDSENTNSLLTEQVSALKEEIRRLQRGNERLDLADNLEYLKNVLFKFLALDSSQVEQKQRLVPVLTTVLKLSPDEANKLSAIATSDKPSTLAGSLFKF